ncbi:hypothetical protein TNCV_2263691 [Trichonephila clavipes]|nr:hypothetical protein TNCV_2263691 [Trichonephila clavipes]
MFSIDINEVLKAHYSVFNGSAKQLTMDFSPMAYIAGFQIRNSLRGYGEERTNDEEYNSKYDSSTEINPHLEEEDNVENKCVTYDETQKHLGRTGYGHEFMAGVSWVPTLNTPKTRLVEELMHIIFVVALSPRIGVVLLRSSAESDAILVT